MLMNKILRFSFVALMAMMGMNVSAADVTDELTWDKLLEAGKSNTYQDFSEKTITSNAAYSGNASSGADKYIQLRTKNNNAGIVTTSSGGKLKSVTITFNTATTDRSIDIYGSNTAYTAASDLYGDNAGTKLGTIASNGESMTLTVDGDYTFVGLRSTKDAIYVDKITIVWDGAGSTPETKTATSIEFAEGYTTRCTPGKDETVALPEATVMAGETAVVGATVTWASSNEEIAPIVNGVIKPVNGSQGSVTITATYAGNDNYKASAKSYTLKLYKGYVVLAELVKDLNSSNEKWDNGGELASFWMGDLVDGEFKSGETLVTYANGNYTYLSDGTNHMLFFGKASVFGNDEQKLKAGDKITMDYGHEQGYDAIWGTAYRYNKLPEFKVESMVVRVKSENNAVNYTTISVDQLGNYLNAPIKIESAQYDSINGKNLYFNVGGVKLAVYNQFSVDTKNMELGATYTLSGMGCVYKTTNQIYLTEFVKTADAPASVNTISTAKKNGAIYNLAGQRVQTMSRGLYIKDGKKFIVK